MYPFIGFFGDLMCICNRSTYRLPSLPERFKWHKWFYFYSFQYATLEKQCLNHLSFEEVDEQQQQIVDRLMYWINFEQPIK